MTQAIDTPEFYETLELQPLLRCIDNMSNLAEGATFRRDECEAEKWQVRVLLARDEYARRSKIAESLVPQEELSP